MKLGNIADFGITDIKATASEKMGWSFTSNGMKTEFVKGNVDGGVGEATLQIECENKESLFIRSAKSVIEQMDNLQSIADAMQTVEKWKSHWKLIREVRRVQDGLVLVSNSGGGTIQLTGGLKEIQGLDQVGIKVRDRHQNFWEYFGSLFGCQRPTSTRLSENHQESVVRGQHPGFFRC